LEIKIGSVGIGKQIGIMATSRLAAGLGIAALPAGGRWPQLYGTTV
jgi:Na+/H+ antiporter NhaA